MPLIFTKKEKERDAFAEKFPRRSISYGLWKDHGLKKKG